MWGQICTFSLMSTLSDKVQVFYKHLFDWTYQQMSQDDSNTPINIFKDQFSFANIIKLDPKHGLNSHWLPYFSVEDISTSCESVKNAGGAVCFDPVTIPGFGVTTLITDPEGGACHIFQPEDKTPPKPRLSSRNGFFCWLELYADEPAAVKDFYDQVFPWHTQQEKMPADPEYQLVKNDRSVIAGITKKPEVLSRERSIWIPFVSVADLNDRMANVKAAGGLLLDEVRPAPEGQYRICRDPGKALFAIYQRS